MKIYRFDDFSGPEIAKIKKEIARRFKDIIFMEAKNKADEIVEQLKGREFYLDDNLNANFSMGFKFISLVEMAGRERRKK